MLYVTLQHTERRLAIQAPSPVGAQQCGQSPHQHLYIGVDDAAELLRRLPLMYEKLRILLIGDSKAQAACHKGRVETLKEASFAKMLDGNIWADKSAE